MFKNNINHRDRDETLIKNNQNKCASKVKSFKLSKCI